MTIESRAFLSDFLFAVLTNPPITAALLSCPHALSGHLVLKPIKKLVPSEVYAFDYISKTGDSPKQKLHSFSVVNILSKYLK